MIKKWIDEQIETLELDLSNKVVLTEVGTGPFALIGLIAARANAQKVILWTADSKYGKGDENASYFEALSSSLNISGNFDFAINRRPKQHIEEADIVTNSGFIRPLDEAFISSMKESSVISYMAESWEFRESDVDLESCERHNVKVAGTWENHPSLKVFDQCGDLAIRMCGDADFVLENKRIAIISDDHFGVVIKNSFSRIEGASVRILQPNEFEDADYDLLFIADYTFEGQLLGRNGALDLSLGSPLQIIHLCGEVDLNYAKELRLNLFPQVNGYHHRMTRTLAYLGDHPVIQLHAAGLKVGELLHKGQYTELVQPILV